MVGISTKEGGCKLLLGTQLTPSFLVLYLWITGITGITYEKIEIFVIALPLTDLQNGAACPRGLVRSTPRRHNTGQYLGAYSLCAAGDPGDASGQCAISLVLCSQSPYLGKFS